MAWAYMLAAAILGALISVQPAMNAVLARALQSPIGASTISVFVAFLSAVVLFLVMGRSADFSRAALTSVPWWIYLAGTVGAIFVAGGVTIAPVIGALMFFVCVVAGQLIGAMVADHFGAFGLQLRPITLMRILGLGLVLAGAIMVQRG
ncbi:DMT family transporter [Acuticoccus sp. M5D2P5]|uniref:DMT family transporter n=1 Tax=Acuticoccus kalidii TaxID=2910977 RepID=UPI001F344F9A|nr:DMT family transporter [Acuticoccus kalidii]MCF3932923.1 DMT family transporter [Acuticoccus kalidii]